jgi:ADP-heptose:LPS heptosyltransferase
MKILIIQLARLGDIYQTWPVVRALRRQYPQAQIQMLARKSYSAACLGLEEIERTWEFDSRSILVPLIKERPELSESVEQVEKLIRDLRGQCFDQVINLTFSPLSSFITHALENSSGSLNPRIRGYTRHSDGYLSIADDASAYFYAQVGPGKGNRFHLTDIMAQVADLELKDEDWRPPTFSKNRNSVVVPKGSIVVHVGASETKKSYGSHKWLQVVRGLLESSERDVVLIGSKAEVEIGQILENVTSVRKPINLVGQTELPDLFQILGSAELLVGCDSAPVHIAALTNTPVLNLSFGTVNFWETGPKSAGSRILVASEPEALASAFVLREALGLLNQKDGFQLGSEHDFAESVGEASVVIVPSKKTEPYLAPKELQFSPAWEMLKAIYAGQLFPQPSDGVFLKAVARLAETNDLALEQIQTLKSQSKNEVAASILRRCDEIFLTLQKASPDLGIIIRWFNTERIRLKPNSQELILIETESLHLRLRKILNLYLSTEGEWVDDNVRLE